MLCCVCGRAETSVFIFDAYKIDFQRTHDCPVVVTAKRDGLCYAGFAENEPVHCSDIAIGSRQIFVLFMAILRCAALRIFEASMVPPRAPRCGCSHHAGFENAHAACAERTERCVQYAPRTRREHFRTPDRALARFSAQTNHLLFESAKRRTSKPRQ